MRAQGTYINDKIDLLIQYLLVDPFQALYSRVRKREVRALLPLCALISLYSSVPRGSPASLVPACSAHACMPQCSVCLSPPALVNGYLAQAGRRASSGLSLPDALSIALIRDNVPFRQHVLLLQLRSEWKPCQEWRVGCLTVSLGPVA